MNAALSAAFAMSMAAGAAAEPVSERRAAELERLVRHDCGSCHGMTLKGGLGPDITARRLAGSEPSALASIILDGVPEKPMPPWRPLLSEAEALWIADYLLKDASP
ncbi:MAG: cytochrome c [Hyphomicrobiaceae bacterium]|nr:cytochrome c [Hyphomicrobiaceae bacterium]